MLVGLLLIVGPALAVAQQAVQEGVSADSTPRDTIKAPFPTSERPRSPEVGKTRVVWDRAAIFASGALTLPELLEQVPGVSVSRSGFIAAPTAVSWYGQPGRLRVYVDGLEWDELDPRAGGSAESSRIPLWAMEEVAVERAAGEVRVHLRTWRQQLTVAETRTDVVTGSDNTNLYRGFYGKRYQNGAGLQLGAQQYSTTNPLVGSDGDALGALMRAGLVRGRWSVDATALRLARSRGVTRRNVVAGPADNAAIGAYRGRDLMAYVRGAYGHADSTGVWMQVLAGTQQFVQDDSSVTGAGPRDSAVARSTSQWLAAVGYTRGGLRVSGTARARVADGAVRVAPVVRTSWDNAWMSVSGVAELGGPDSTQRLDLLARARVFSWLHLGGGVSQYAPHDEGAEGPRRLTSRAELGLTWRDRWLTVGAVRRSEARVLGMPVFDADYLSAIVPAATGLEVGVRGRIVGPLSLEWRGLAWETEGLYRPSVESRAELRVDTDLRRKLPRAKFNLSAAVLHEYRNDVLFPDGAGGVVRAKGASSYGTLLDLRIGTANIFWYNRNLTGTAFSTVPGYLMPRLVQLYGIRWDFRD